MARSLRIGLVAGIASIIIAVIAFAQTVAFPVAPPGTPTGYVPVTANTLGQTIWVPPAFAADGGVVTLAGDVTGASNANTVVALTGSAGTTSLKSNLTPSVDNADTVGTSADRLLSVATGPNGFQVYHAVSSTPVAILSDNAGSGQVVLGADGFASDTRLVRVGAHDLTIDNASNNSAQVEIGGTAANYVRITSAGAIDPVGTTPVLTFGDSSTATLTLNTKTVGGEVVGSLGGTQAWQIGGYPSFESTYTAFWGGLNGASPVAGNIGFYVNPSGVYINAGELVPGGNGFTKLGDPANIFSQAFIGGATGLGYTEFAAATGVHNTQDALSVCWNDSEHMTTYSAKNFNVYPLGGGSLTTAHGLSYTCTITGRVVTAGTGTGCTFWATGAHGTPDTTFACTVRATGQLHGGVWSAYAAPYYIVCDVTGSTNPSTGTGPTNPVFTFSATTSTSPNEVTVQWAPFNDVCGTSAPVIDAQSRCCVEDD